MKITRLLIALIILLPTVTTVSAQQNQIQRTYEIFVPETYDTEQALPLLVVLHGAGGSGAWMEAVTGFNEIAEEEDFAVVYPDGISNNWDLGMGVRTPEGTLRVDDIAFITALIDQMAANYNVDTERVYVTGFSNGAILAYILACYKPELFAGVAAVAAPMAVPIAQNCSDVPISVMLIHGTDDPILSWESVFSPDGELVGLSAPDTFLFWSEHNGCDLDANVAEELPDVDPEDQSLVRTMSYTGCNEDTQVKFYGIDGGGHTWAGHLIEAPFQLGPTNMDIDASQEIWTWFANLDQG